MVEIREVNSTTDIGNSLRVIRDSFRTVAREFKLTRKNNPTHPSFITRERLSDLQKKARFFGLFENGNQVGFVAVEKADGNVYYLDKLAVLPHHRHQGHGKKLVEFVVEYVKKNGGEKVSLCMIDSHRVLKSWYQSLGFSETATKKFEHLPFVVCFMERAVSS
ncbi:MAG: GNAT family N-acetyltransferase [Chloroflexi bacterium]|jgi:ribosomal protein S18 acetylase RimI-like enzyme|nr:GNAT family N-acetyltransferase [Chloroflexota bacterium]